MRVSGLLRKASSSKLPLTQNRGAIITAFQRLATHNTQNGQAFKSRAYVTAIRALNLADTPLNEAQLVSELSPVRGVGPRLIERGKEIIRTGKLAELDKIALNPTAKAEAELETVYGIGNKLAKKLVNVHNVKSLDELREVDKKRQLLTQVQRIGLEYHADITQKIPRAEMKKHDALLRELIVDGTKGSYVVAVCGSYRRGLPKSSDIDVLVSLAKKPKTTAKGAVPKDRSRALQALVDSLTKAKYVEQTLSVGGTKFMGICRLGGGGKKNKKNASVARRIDIRWVEPSAFPAAMLYFTGSKDFNTRMRRIALTKLFTINEYGVYPLATNTKYDDPSKPVPVAMEEDIFKLIEMPFVKPQNRTD